MSVAQHQAATLSAVDEDFERLIRESAAAFASRNELKRVRALRSTRPGFDIEVWASMAQQGWIGAIIPERMGGQGLPVSALAIFVEEWARTLGPEPVSGCAGFAVSTLLGCGKPAEHLLSEIAAGKRIVGVAWQPAGGGSVTAAPEIQAEPAPNGLVLNGTAHHLYPALGIHNLVVAAQLGGELYLIDLPTTRAGVDIEPRERADGTFSGTVRLRNAAVGNHEIIARGAVAENALAAGRDVAALLAAVELFAAGDHAFSITIEYLKTRVQFGRPIGSFQALQHRAADLYIQKELSRAVLKEALRALDTGNDMARTRMTISRAKARCSLAALLIGREAVKLHGAIAYTDDCDIGLYLKRILSLAAMHGTAAEHRARWTRCIGDGTIDDLDAEEKAGAVPDQFLADERIEVDWNTFSDADFRAGIRAYFEAHYPAALRNLGRRGTPSEMAEWLARMSSKGWTAPAWPTEHGGMGLSPVKQVIFIEERERAGIARHPDQGVVMFGPMLMRHGTEAQRRHYLPKILTNEHFWCQGYSEPDAGSDLAGLRTRAERQGDVFVVNGSKIWTTMAHHATHIFLLARTDTTAAKHDGISFLVTELDVAGIEVRPIRNIAGHEDFCQVFFDDVKIPAENLVGEINQGWSVAKSLLGFERLNNGSPRRVQGPLEALKRIAVTNGAWSDPAFLTDYTAAYLDVADLKSAYARFSGIVETGAMPGPEISQLKIWAGDCAQRVSEMLISTAGADGGVTGLQTFGEEEIDVLAPFYLMFPAQIASGSNDIQRNILARRVLGLPK